MSRHNGSAVGPKWMFRALSMTRIRISAHNFFLDLCELARARTSSYEWKSFSPKIQSYCLHTQAPHTSSHTTGSTSASPTCSTLQLESDILQTPSGDHPGSNSVDLA